MAEYIRTDRYGKPIGKRHGSASDKRRKQLLKSQADTQALIDLFKIGKTIYGGLDLISNIMEKGIKDVVMEKVDFIPGLGKDKFGRDILKDGPPMASVDLFKEKTREGIKSFLPDLRKASDRWEINPEVTRYFSTLNEEGKAKFVESLSSVFNEEQLTRARSKGLLTQLGLGEFPEIEVNESDISDYEKKMTKFMGK